jgi:hypothetical protein
MEIDEELVRIANHIVIPVAHEPIFTKNKITGFPVLPEMPLLHEQSLLNDAAILEIILNKREEKWRKRKEKQKSRKAEKQTIKETKEARNHDERKDEVFPSQSQQNNETTKFERVFIFLGYLSDFLGIFLNRGI